MRAIEKEGELWRLVSDVFFILIVCVFYIFIQWIYIHNLPLVMDEFQQASSSFRVLIETPYQDYSPYKTLLGYYSHSWVLNMYSQSEGGSSWVAIMKAKEFIVILNAAAIFFIGLYCRKLFDIKAVVVGLASLLLISTFLERSSALRVDMLTAWFGVAGLLFLLGKRLVLAGILTGLSFLVSQKGVYYCVAIFVSFGLYSLIYSSLKEGVKNCFILAFSILIPVIVYLVFWTAITGDESVLFGVFFRNTHVVFLNIYQEMNRFWFQIISRNLSFFMVVGVAFFWFFVQSCKKKIDEKSAIVSLYSLLLLVFCISHKQPWPYFFVVLLPTLALLVIAFVDDLLRSFESKRVFKFCSLVLVASFVFFLIRFPLVIARDNTFQKETIILMESMLPINGTYLSGFNASLRFRHISGERLSWLDVRGLAKLRSVGDKKVISSMEQDMPMVVLDNYRIQNLSSEVKNFLTQSYSDFCKGLWIYSLKSGEEYRDNTVYFSGRYMAISVQGNTSLNGNNVEKGAVVNLKKGDVVKMRGLSLIYYPAEIEKEMKKVEAKLLQGYCNQPRFFHRVYSY